MYGMPPGYKEELYIRGYVKSKNTNERITGISIWIKGVTANYTYFSLMDGRFSFSLPKMDNYTIIFTDIDGSENGSFKPLTFNYTREQMESLGEWIIPLEEVDEE